MNKQAELQKDVIIFLEDPQAVKHLDDGHRVIYILNTIYGDLSIILHKSDTEKPLSKVYSVYCRFHEVDRVDLVDVNSFTGKYNFHDYDADKLKQVFFNRIYSIIVYCNDCPAYGFCEVDIKPNTHRCKDFINNK